MKRVTNFNAKYFILGSASNCPDKKISNVASSLVNVWHKTPIRWSAMACNINNQVDYTHTGNELFMDNHKIVHNALLEEYGGGGILETNSDRECQVECFMRTGICGAWSFEKSSKKCHLHSVRSCCGQYDNYQDHRGWVSGFICERCWSTLGPCPCTDDYLQLGIKEEFLIKGNLTVI